MKTRILFGLSCLLLLTGCATDAVTGKKTYNFNPLQKDIELGSQIYSETADEMKQRGVPVNADAARVAQLKEMVSRISAASDLPDLPYEVMLIQTNIVNAMAAPGGKIMVFEGLWNPKDGLVRDDAELAAVIAHEIAHVNCRHSTEAMTRNLSVNLVSELGVAFSKGTKYEKYAQLAAAGGVILYDGLLVMCYSRADEKEADAVGLMYMAKAGYDPNAALRIWERSAQRSNGANPAASIFSTHPPDAVRLENLKKQLPAAMAVYEASKSR